jgi:hypothetical protein
MHLNKLRDIKRIKSDKFKFSSVGEDDETSDDDNIDNNDRGNSPDRDENSKEIAAFDIDSKVKDGRLALMYRGNTNKPQIWF